MNSINLFHDTVAAMNSRLDVVLWSKDSDAPLKSVFEKMTEKVREVELTYSKFDEDAEVYQLNNNAADMPFAVSKTLFEMLEKCLEFHRKTNGYFNIGYSSNQPLDRQLVLDNEELTVGFISEETCLDFGGIGKGIALSEIDSILKEEEELNAFISFGGSSILTRGSHPHGDFWPLALEDDIQTNLQLNNHAVSISGTHQHREGGLHIIDPQTGELKHRQGLVVVQMDCPIEAEVLSTALLVAPEESHQSIIDNFKIEKMILQ